MKTKISLAHVGAFRVAVTLLGLAVVLGACTHTSEDVTASIPNDYRQRHPSSFRKPTSPW